jgi:hypothetical protein
MQVDHGGLGPPTANQKPQSAKDTIFALLCVIDKHLENSEIRQRENDADFAKFEKITAEYFAKFGNQNKRGLSPPSNKQNNTLHSAIDTHTKVQEGRTESDPSPSPSDIPMKSTATSPNSSRLIVSSTRFPDPKNCAGFLQPTTRENEPCWFHRDSRRAASTPMTQQETIEGGPLRPHRVHPWASLPTTQFFALTLGATCSAEHYHAFRRPPPARDKKKARRVLQKQATHKNKYFKIPSKLTRGATLRKKHYQVFRKPPPTRDRKHDWTKNHHE